jgi:plasmid stabilization system protein ParE
MGRVRYGAWRLRARARSSREGEPPAPGTRTWLFPLAEQDLDEVWLYVAEGRLRPEFGTGVLSFVADSYVIYHRADDDVLIARVLHGRRDEAAAWTA